jgi:hypothetical protein
MIIKRLLGLFLLFFIVINADTQEQTIIEFKNLITLKGSLDYNFLIFDQSSLDHGFLTNRPLDFGIGIGIFNFSIDFSFSIPFLYDQNYKKSQSFDFSVNRFFKNTGFIYSFFKYYNGFNDRSDNNIDLKILDMGFTYEHILNKNHSIRSVYVLDCRQTVSNGSFLIGGGIFFSSIKSEYKELNNYSERQNAFYFGPNFGYSYTWIMQENFFFNILSTFGINCIRSNGEFTFGLQALPKLSLGYHSKTWSANIYSNFSYLLAQYKTENEYNLLSGNIGLSFIKRF